MSNVITALFETPTKAAIAIHQLEIMGVTQDEISVIAGDKVSGNSFALDEGTKLPEGLAIGSVSGGLLAGIISGLTAVGAVATGGLGLLASWRNGRWCDWRCDWSRHTRTRSQILRSGPGKRFSANRR